MGLYSAVNFRPLASADLDWVADTVSDYFGSPRVVSKGVLHDALGLRRLIAEQGSQPVGLLQYRIQGRECEVVILISVLQRRGIARRLIEAVIELGRENSCRRLWLVTTINNETAIAEYRALGWTQVAVHKGAVREARVLKPEIPIVDEQGRPIKDEIEFGYRIEIDKSGPPDDGGRG